MMQEIEFVRTFSMWTRNSTGKKKLMWFSKGDILKCRIEELPPNPNFKTHKITTPHGYSAKIGKSQLSFMKLP